MAAIFQIVSIPVESNEAKYGYVFPGQRLKSTDASKLG